MFFDIQKSSYGPTWYRKVKEDRKGREGLTG